MKYLLTPLTVLVWYLLSYYGIYLAVFLMGFMFSLNWIILIFGYLPLISIIFALTSSIPSILKTLILKGYGLNLFIVIIHSLAGLAGIFSVFYLFYSIPTSLNNGDNSTFMLKGMWQLAPFKTIMLVFPFTGLFISLIWSASIAPIYLKVKGI